MKREFTSLHARHGAARACAAVAVCTMLAGLPVRADDVEARAGEAVANIIFDYDGSSEFVSYRVRPDGFVDAVFASNTPGALYDEIVEKLRRDPGIKGVLAGKGGPVCSRF